MVGSGVAIYACLKRNAYGCGAVPVAQVMQREGADAIAVGNINDALAIREAQITLPILLYPNCLAPEAGSALMRHRLMPTISSLDDVAAWEQAADGGSLRLRPGGSYRTVPAGAMGPRPHAQQCRRHRGRDPGARQPRGLQPGGESGLRPCAFGRAELE